MSVRGLYVLLLTCESETRHRGTGECLRSGKFEAFDRSGATELARKAGWLIKGSGAWYAKKAHCPNRVGRRLQK